MIYLDSNVFLYSVSLDPKVNKLTASSRAVIRAMTRGELEAATSALTWDEVFWVLKKKLGREIAADEGKKFLGLANLQILKVSEITIRKAQEIAERCGIDPRDAIHAATCIENGIGEIVSDDPDFDRVGRQLKRLGPNSFSSTK
jgi:uncharacterized protein